MKKQFLKMLLCGAVAISTSIVTSCSDDDVDDLKSRVTVVEGMIKDLKSQLENATTTGATILSATQDNKGVWTLALSDGKSITITPPTGGSSGGGGSIVTVEKDDTTVTITVDNEKYVLPLGGAVNSLIYSPEYTDGVVRIGTDGLAMVNFIARPAISADNLKSAVFEIAESHELKTRASGTMFKVKGEVTLDGEFIKVPLQALNVEGGKTYAVALLMTFNGTVISSNYFNVSVAEGFSFVGEAIIRPELIAEVSDYQELTDGFSTATLPDAKVDFLDEFNFKDLFTSLPDGTIEFELGDRDAQNNNVRERYDFFKSCLSADGTWQMQGRPGTNCSAPKDDKNPSGLLIYLKANDVIKAKIYWQIVDPIADADWDTPNKTINGAPHYEFNQWGTSTGKFDIQKGLYDGFDLLHTEGFDERWQAYQVADGDILYVDGGHLQLGDLGKKYAKFSRGVFFLNIQTSLANGTKEIADGTVKGSEHEVMEGKDGISLEEMAENGVSITEDGFINFEAGKYVGQGFRVGPGCRYEYAYGEKTIGDNVLAFIWINRR